MSKKKIFGSIFIGALLVFGLLQLLPAAPLVLPAKLPNASNADLRGLEALGLKTLVDLRSTAEKKEEPDRLPNPPTFKVVEIPVLDDANEAMVGEIMERIESGNFEGFDPHETMLEGNRQFANEFTPQFRQFMQTVVANNGAPIVWHCSAGKDRARFAAAILLRTLGVPQDVVIQVYMASKEHALAARREQLWFLRLFKGAEAADKIAVLMGVEETWLQAAFDEIDKHWGGFQSYVSDGLQLSAEDIAQLKNTLLQPISTVP